MPVKQNPETEYEAVQAADKELKSKRLRLLRSVLIVFTAGVAYALFTTVTGLGIPCFFHLLTGLKCPGCGVSRMILALLRGDIASAYAANPFVLVTLPFILFELGFAFFCRWNDQKMPKWNDVLLLIYLVFLLAFGVYRNIME